MEHRLSAPFAAGRRPLDDWTDAYDLHLRAREHRGAVLGAAGARLLGRAGQRVVAFGGAIGLALRELGFARRTSP